MGRTNQAPMLRFDKPKVLGENYYALPQEIMDVVNNELGNSSAQLRVMMVLIGTKPGFRVSEKWLSDRTGVKGKSLTNVRKALVDRGWLKWEESGFYEVCFNAILGSDNDRGVMVTPQKQGGNDYTPKQTCNDYIPIQGSNDYTSKNRGVMVTSEQGSNDYIPDVVEANAEKVGGSNGYTPQGSNGYQSIQGMVTPIIDNIDNRIDNYVEPVYGMTFKEYEEKRFGLGYKIVTEDNEFIYVHQFVDPENYFKFRKEKISV